MAGLGKILVLSGLLLLLHAGYSTMQHRSFLKLAEEDYTGLPIDIGLECIVATILCSVGVIIAMGKFTDIQLTTELNTKSYETLGNRPGFFIFNHRGPAVYDALR